MPDGTTDIFLDATFFDFGHTSSGTEDANINFRVKEADNIGIRTTYVDYFTKEDYISSLTYPAYAYVASSGTVVSGTRDTTIYITTSSSGISDLGMEVALVDYSIPPTSSGLSRYIDTDLKYYNRTTIISGSFYYKLKYTAGKYEPFSTNLINRYRTTASNIVYNDYEADYIAGGYYNEIDPIPPWEQVVNSGTGIIFQKFYMGQLSHSGTLQKVSEVFFAGYPMEFDPDKYSYRFHLAAGLEGSKQAAEWEATVISGSVLDIPANVLSTAVTSGNYNFDSVCGLTDLVSYSFNSEVISGTIGHYFYNAVCGVSGTNGYSFDVDLLSLKISNFSLDIDGYTATSGVICVDLTDDIHNVLTSQSYFIIGETVTSGNIFTPIIDGYTMCYDSPTEFDELVGATTITVHTENDNGDILERDFYLTSGYIVEYNNINHNYGFGNQVVVRGLAENMASCPSVGVAAYSLITEPKITYNLGATIVGIPWGERDLSAEITPTTDTIYFYGKTFRIEVRAKDFAGNVMEPFVFEFRIEDKPE